MVGHCRFNHAWTELPQPIDRCSASHAFKPPPFEPQYAYIGLILSDRLAWETNDTRYSFGCYHFAAYGDSVKTGKEMGHRSADDVLFNDYRRLTTKADGERYFALVPKSILEEPLRFQPLAVMGDM